ncbi:MAG: ABC transporter ATP-binding protein [Thermoplasmata archaeon]|nr:ABC transporter ATP-binding protein [Thermoplasmata archaeon]
MKNKRMPLIELRNVSKIYTQYGTEIVALNNVSLKVLPGEFVSIVGPSGSGKSTLLHCMGLLDRPTKGKVFVEGRDTSKITGKEIATLRGKKIGFVFQNYNLIPRLTVLDNVILPGLIIGKDEAKLTSKALELLEEVGIKHRADHKGVHLSGGEQQRVAIARALINDPIVIIADEPTGALDSESSSEIMELLAKLNKDRKVTIVFVSHDLDIARYGRRNILLKDGKIIKDSKESRLEEILKEASKTSKEVWR